MPEIVTIVATGPEAGVNPVIVGSAPTTDTLSAADTPPPGNGVNTVTGTVPEALSKLPGTSAVNCVALMVLLTNCWAP